MNAILTKKDNKIESPSEWDFNIYYILNYLSPILVGPLKLILRYQVGKLNTQLDGLINDLYELYLDVENASSEEASEMYESVRDIRKSATKQKNRLKDLNLVENKNLAKRFYRLVRLSNRVEARVQKKMYSDKEVEGVSEDIKNNIIKNSNEIVGNALQQEANR